MLVLSLSICWGGANGVGMPEGDGEQLSAAVEQDARAESDRCSARGPPDHKTVSMVCSELSSAGSRLHQWASSSGVTTPSQFVSIR